jgi:hypothetical protein
MTDALPAKGPRGYENWKAAQSGAEQLQLFEVYLYSDAWITGEVEEAGCPYSFLNTVPLRHHAPLTPVLALRVRVHLEHEIPVMDVTDTSRYHGGSFVDEIAALTSLAMGVRLQAGGRIREFSARDPLGRPRAEPNVPALASATSTRGPRIPRAHGKHNLNAAILPLFSIYPRLGPTDAIALVRAARLYQDALWIIESEPHLAWLFLVSALEAVATPLHVKDADATSVLQASYPELAKVLEAAGGADHLDKVSSLLLPMMKATARFLRFVMQHLPPPPTERPAEDLQVPWDPASMKRMLAKIYDYRSRALHDGTPFPEPMSGPEVMQSEIPLGAAAGMHDAVWTRDDMPMLLCVFEHITRGTLLKWWQVAGAEAG